MLSDDATRILALGVLAGFGLALLWITIRNKRRTPYRWAQMPVYLYSRILSRIVWRTTVHGQLPIPDEQGAVIVCNHISGIDPAFVALTTNRPVHWMVAKEYCQHPAMAWFFKTIEAIPVNRGGIDTAATKLSIRYVQQGELLGMFPEGRINETSELLLPGRPGAALIALKARAPVVPCFVSGAPYDGSVYGSLFMAAKVTLRVGQAIDLTPYYVRAGEAGVLEELTKRFLIEIARLGGCDDFEPQLAGRRWKPGTEAEAATAAR